MDRREGIKVYSRILNFLELRALPFGIKTFWNPDNSSFVASQFSSSSYNDLIMSVNNDGLDCVIPKDAKLYCRPVITLIYDHKNKRTIKKIDFEGEIREIVQVKMQDEKLLPCWVTNNYREDNFFRLLPVKPYATTEFNVARKGVDYKDSKIKEVADSLYENLAEEEKANAVLTILNDNHGYKVSKYLFTEAQENIIKSNRAYEQMIYLRKFTKPKDLQEKIDRNTRGYGDREH
jgi:hypothetical protein